MTVDGKQPVVQGYDLTPKGIIEALICVSRSSRLLLGMGTLDMWGLVGKVDSYKMAQSKLAPAG